MKQKYDSDHIASFLLMALIFAMLSSLLSVM